MGERCLIKMHTGGESHNDESMVKRWLQEAEKLILSWLANG